MDKDRARPLMTSLAAGLRLAPGLALAAALLRLAFPPWSLPWAGVPGAALFFLLLSRTRRPMAAGFFFHALYGLLLSFYLFTSLSGWFHIGLFPSLAVFFLVAGVFPSVLFTLFCGLAHPAALLLARPGPFLPALGRALWIAAGFCLAEFGRAALSPERGFGHFACAWWKVSLIRPMAAVTGEAGLSFLFVLLSLLLCRAASLALQKNFRQALAALGAAGLFLLAGAGLAGIYGPAPDAGRALSVALVHPVLSQSQRWKSEYFRPHLAKYLQMSREARFPDGSAPRLLVWPETALTWFVLQDPETMDAVREAAAASKAFLLMGAPTRVGRDEDLSTRNSALLFTPRGELSGTYDKVHLLPLAEKKLGPWGLPATGTSGRYRPGDGTLPLAMDGNGRDIARLGVAVCFEIGIFSHVRSLWRNGADVFVNISNDAWFGDSSESEQQLALLSLACAQYRLPGIRATGYGEAALVDGAGNVLQQTGIEEKTVLAGTISVPAHRARPPAARFPNWFILLCGGVFLAGLALRLAGKSKARTV